DLGRGHLVATHRHVEGAEHACGEVLRRGRHLGHANLPARIVDERHVRESPTDINPDPPGHAAFAPLGGGFIVDWLFDIAEGLSPGWTASSGRSGTTSCDHDSYPPPPDRSFLSCRRGWRGRHHPRRRGKGLHRRLERRG